MQSQLTGMYITSPSHRTLPMLLISIAALDFMILLAPGDSVVTVHKHRQPFNKISAILTEEVEKIEANLPEPLEEIDQTTALETKVTPTVISVSLAEAMGRAGTVAAKMSAAGAVAKDITHRSSASSTFTSPPTVISVAMAEEMSRADTVAAKMSAAGAVTQDFARRSAASSTFTSRFSNLAKTS